MLTTSDSDVKIELTYSLYCIKMTFPPHVTTINFYVSINLILIQSVCYEMNEGSYVMYLHQNEQINTL